MGFMLKWGTLRQVHIHRQPREAGGGGADCPKFSWKEVAMVWEKLVVSPGHVARE